MNILVREAEPTDADGMWHLIHELAVFEHSEEEHVVGAEQLRTDLMNKHFTAFVAETENGLAGLALLYPIYSTWKGASWYLEDIIVAEDFRRQGIGSRLFEKTLEFAAANQAGRLGWQVLSWNEPAIQFYKKYGALLDEEWINCRLTPEQLKKATLKEH